MSQLILLLLFTLLPPAASADPGQCRQQCYVENSRCDRDSNSGCSGALQSCLQACPQQ